MAISTALLAAARRPVVLTIGRRRVVCRPLSVEQVLEAQCAVVRGDREELAEARLRLLRAALPPAPRWAPSRDPLRGLLAVPGAIGPLLTRLTAIPVTLPEGPPTSDDPYAELRALQRALVRPSAPRRARGVSLAVAAQAVRDRLGDGWYFDPRRWPTTDGYAPHAECWVQWHALEMAAARDQLAILTAIRAAQAGRGARTASEATRLAREWTNPMIAAAYPTDPLVSAPPPALVS